MRLICPGNFCLRFFFQFVAKNRQAHLFVHDSTLRWFDGLSIIFCFMRWCFKCILMFASNGNNVSFFIIRSDWKRRTFSYPHFSFTIFWAFLQHDSLNRLIFRIIRIRQINCIRQTSKISREHLFCAIPSKSSWFDSFPVYMEESTAAGYLRVAVLCHVDLSQHIRYFIRVLLRKALQKNVHANRIAVRHR